VGGEWDLRKGNIADGWEGVEGGRDSREGSGGAGGGGGRIGVGDEKTLEVWGWRGEGMDASRRLAIGGGGGVGKEGGWER